MHLSRRFAGLSRAFGGSEHRGKMGLDSVEMLLAVEREFDVEISDAEAAHIASRGTPCADCHPARPLAGERGRQADLSHTFVTAQSIVVRSDLLRISQLAA